LSVTTVRTPADYENELRRYRFERMEETRAVAVGEKEVSEQAAIVERYADLFSREQLDALRRAEEEAADEDERERLYRLRKMCEAGLIAAEVTEQEDQLENKILAVRVTFQGKEMPLRTAQARVGVLPEYADREELGRLYGDETVKFNDERLELLRGIERLEAELSGIDDPVERSEELKGVSLRKLASVLAEANEESAARYASLRERWLARLLGDERDETPSSYHAAYLRRLSPLEATYPRERSTDVCLATLRELGFDVEAQPNIKLDLEDRPQKSPRASVIPSDPPDVVHLITRPVGGIRDYEAFLHEAGHALHYGGCDSRLPFTFRSISRDHALTELYSYIVQSVAREPGWHERHFGLSATEAAENAEGLSFIAMLLFRRSIAKLQFELEFWSGLWENGASPERFGQLVTDAIGLRQRPDFHLVEMDEGFYIADYLRAYLRSAQLRDHLRREVGEEWWRSQATGDLLRSLMSQGTRPASEDVATRLGYEPFDAKPLLAEYGVAA
jgi:hypothetical protein